MSRVELSLSPEVTERLEEAVELLGYVFKRLEV